VHPELTPELEEVVRKWAGVATRNGGLVVRGKDFTLCMLGDCIHTDVFRDVGRKFSIDIGMIPLQGKRKGATPEEAVKNGLAIVRDLNLKVLLPVIQYTREKSHIELLKRKLKEMGMDTKLIFDEPGVSHII
jgi:L-ascorbate metabolism protein UlaG (beta-lactamase superfamily)